MGMRRMLLAGLLVANGSPAEEPPASRRPPAPEELAALVADTRQKALEYSANLPNFICTQVTRRSRASATKSEPVWKLSDTLTIRLTYFGQKENYRVVQVNAKSADKSLNQVGGWSTKGDFGGMLRDVFAEKSQAKFEWDRWDTWNGRAVSVLAWSIDRPHSPFESIAQRNLKKVRANWAGKGLAVVDAETRQVLHLTIDSIDNADSPTRNVHVTIDYREQKVGDRAYLLPFQSISVMTVGGAVLKSESQFTEYRKFSAESEIKFELPPESEAKR